MPLYTQLSSVKSRLNITDTTDDTILTNMIKHCSTRFDHETRRNLDRAANTTEEFTADSTELRLGRTPIESVASFHLKTNEAEGWVLQSDVDYLIHRNSIISLSWPLGSSHEILRVTYTGGYVLPGTTPGAGQTALPDDLEQSCIEQVAFWYQHRNRLGLVTVPAEGRTFFSLAPLDLLAHVKSTLQKYERYLN